MWVIKNVTCLVSTTISLHVPQLSHEETPNEIIKAAILASLAIALITQHQEAAAFNEKNNLEVGSSHSHGTCENDSHCNPGTAYNNDDEYSNTGCNTHRFDDICKENSFTKPH